MAGATVNASWHESDGISAATAGREKDGYRNLTVGLNGRLTPIESLRFGLTARHTDDNLEFDSTDFATGVPVDADNETEKQLTNLGLDGSLSSFSGRWTNSLRFTWLDTDSRDTSNGTQSSRFAATKYGLYFQSSLLMGREQPASQRLTLAVDYEEEDYLQRTSFAAQDQTLDNTGVVLEYYGNPGDGLDVSLSVRYDDNSVFRDVTTWRAAGGYLFDRSRTRIRASAGTGQKRPTFTERFGFAPDSFIGNPDLKPERNEGFDIGIEQWLMSERLQLGATYFNERLRDEIATVFDGATFQSTTVNLDGKSKRSGAELTLASRLTDTLTLSASYTYTSSRQPDNTGERQVREVRRPRHMAAVNLNHSIEDRGNVNLNLSYTGAQEDLFFGPPSFSGASVRLDPYTLFNITGSYQVTRWLSLFGRAENLFDKDYEDVFGFQNPGRGFYLGLKLQTGP